MGLAVAVAGVVLGATGVPAEVRSYRRRKADETANIANLKLRRRRLQHTKADALVRLTEERQELDSFLDDRHRAAQAHEQRKTVRMLELENLIIDADLESTANEFPRYGLDVEAIDNE